MQQSLIIKMLKMSPRAIGKHNPEAPDDEDAGQETPVLAPASQVEIHAQAAAASEDAAQEETCTQKAAEAPALAYRSWSIPTMSETFDFDCNRFPRIQQT